MYYQSAVFFTRGTASWTHELIGGDIGWNPWMVLASNGAAHFVYHGYNGVSYATNEGGSWVEEPIDLDGQNEADDISLDASGRPMVVYVAATLVSYDPYLYSRRSRHARREAPGSLGRDDRVGHQSTKRRVLRPVGDGGGDIHPSGRLDEIKEEPAIGLPIAGLFACLNAHPPAATWAALRAETR